MKSILGVIILFAYVLCQHHQHYPGKAANVLLEQQTGNEIVVPVPHPVVQLPQDLDIARYTEWTRAEEVVMPLGTIENIGANMIITLSILNYLINYQLICDCKANRYNSSDHSRPWIVAINHQNDHICTGSILNKEWIITAAHCFSSVDPANYSVLTGTSMKTDGNEYRISRILLHPRYDASNHKSSDLSLLKIDGQMHLSDYIKPIDLPSLPFEEVVPGHHIVTSGWGKENIFANETEHYLGEIRVTIIASELCASAYRNLGQNGHLVFRSQICTWNLNQNICQGNSGGPAVMYKGDKPVLIATVSYGVKCLDNYPIVFTKLSYFLNWINKTMQDNRY